MNKYIKPLLILTLSLLSLVVHSEEKVRERVYIVTDKQSYIAGDKLWCSVYCFKMGDSSLSLTDFSSVAYIELQTNNQVVLTSKVALIEGRGAGVIELPPVLPTGNYRLVGYTAQNRNEIGFIPKGDVIPIYNTLTNDRVEGGVVISPDGVEEAILSAGIESDLGSICEEVVVEVKGDVSVGEEFSLKLRSSLEEAVSLSLSVYKKDIYLSKYDLGIKNYCSELLFGDKGEVKDEYLPDYEGEVIRLQTNGEKGERVRVSFPGESVDCYVSQVGEGGVVEVITPNLYGSKDLVCQGVSDVSIIDPFLRKVVGGIPKLRLTPSMGDELSHRGFSMQVGRRFDSDTLYSKLKVRPNTLLGEKSVIYNLDDYTRFPLMEEVLVEYVNEVKILTHKKEKHLSVLVNSNGGSTYSTGYSLVLLDGVPVLNHRKIIEYDPLLVEKIEIYQGVYSVGGVFYEGVANFITYRKDMSGYSFSSEETILPYVGSSYPLSFECNQIVVDGNYPDYRETIYWHPLLEVDSRGEIDIRCVAPLYEGDFMVVVEGVSHSGSPIYYQTSLKIR